MRKLGKIESILFSTTLLVITSIVIADILGYNGYQLLFTGTGNAILIITLMAGVINSFIMDWILNM